MSGPAHAVFLVVLLGMSACAAPPAAPPTTPAATAPDSNSAAPSAASGGSSAASATADPSDTEDPLLTAALIDVRSGDTFTIGELAADGPVLVETMAIWCSNCRAQQHEVVDAHALAEFHSISVDVDPNERADDLAEYADREGFDWRFVLADAELATMLRDRFTPAVLNPPSMPKLLVTSDGQVELVGLNTQLSAEEIAALFGG